MRVHGWSNGQAMTSGAGYGIRIALSDRDQFFDRSWEGVTIRLDSSDVRVRLSMSFWKTCTELRSAEIGRWMMRHRLAPWSKGTPPALTLEPLGGNRFELTVSERVV